MNKLAGLGASGLLIMVAGREIRELAGEKLAGQLLVPLGPPSVVACVV